MGAQRHDLDRGHRRVHGLNAAYEGSTSQVFCKIVWLTEKHAGVTLSFPILTNIIDGWMGHLRQRPRRTTRERGRRPETISSAPCGRKQHQQQQRRRRHQTVQERTTDERRRTMGRGGGCKQLWQTWMHTVGINYWGIDRL